MLVPNSAAVRNVGLYVAIFFRNRSTIAPQDGQTSKEITRVSLVKPAKTSAWVVEPGDDDILTDDSLAGSVGRLPGETQQPTVVTGLSH